MDYYDRRVQATQIIDGLHSQGVDDDTIIYSVGSEFGLSEEVIKKRLSLLKRLKENKSKAELVKQKVSDEVKRTEKIKTR